MAETWSQRRPGAAAPRSLRQWAASKEYGEIWQAARHEVFTKAEVTSPFAEVPYFLRHAGVPLWLDSGVPPTEVARRAGHSITVLFRFYAKSIHGGQNQANALIEGALKADSAG
ncbi:hypothetical protein [Streptomyces sp. bgisy082]|uniref:hypothetical protein n=1 Tax=Streptomyces sp. bgisy082 TaxID=3413776 RepID=UPI003D73736D